LKKRKKGSSALDQSSHQRSRSKNNNTPSFPPLFSHFLDDEANTFVAENNEPFFVVHSLFIRSVLPLVVN